MVVQQGMNTENQTARRYHWLSSGLKQIEDKKDFIEEPHSGIASELRVRPLNLTAKKSKDNRVVSLGLVRETPKTFLKDLDLIQTKRAKNLTEMSLRNKEFYWHPVVEEKFNMKRLEKTIFNIKEQDPKSFEQLVYLKGVGPRTIRALSLVAEVIYGARPSYQDPARYTFAHGGKDNVPTPIDRGVYDKTIEIMERGINKSQLSLREKALAQDRLAKRKLS